MATNQRRAGIDHLTVVPENFELPEDGDEDDDTEESSDSGRMDV